MRAQTEDSPACPRPSPVSEKKISGGLTFLTHTHLTVGARRGLIARAGAADALLIASGVGRMSGCFEVPDSAVRYLIAAGAGG